MADAIILEDEIRTLLAAKNGDAALLWLCLRSGRRPEESGLTGPALTLATAFLRQTGLLQDPVPRFQTSDERPSFTEADVNQRLSGEDNEFKALIGDVQRRLGRMLNTEELKILLGITDYLGMSREVVNMLLCYCIDRSRSLGGVRLPTLRAIEKEAYHWADEGIDTLESAAAYVQLQLGRSSRVQQAAEIMGLGGRKLMAQEEKLILSWLDMGFGREEIKLAFEKTCMNTGTLKWPYMNSILKSWHAKGLHSVQAIEQQDKKPAAPGRAQEFQRHGEAISPLMREAAQRLLQENEG